MREQSFEPAPLRAVYRLLLGLWLLAAAAVYWRVAQGLPTTTEFVVLGIGWMALFVWFPAGMMPTRFRLIAPRAMPENPDDTPLLVVGQRWSKDERHTLTGPVRHGVDEVAPRPFRAWLASGLELTDWDRAVVCERDWGRKTVISPADPQAFVRAWERMVDEQPR